MADPTCPACSAEGIENIVSAESSERAKGGNPWFHVVFCDRCGHIYGVLAKHVFGPSSGPTLVVKDHR